MQRGEVYCLRFPLCETRLYVNAVGQANCTNIVFRASSTVRYTDDSLTVRELCSIRGSKCCLTIKRNPICELSLFTYRRYCRSTAYVNELSLLIGLLLMVSQHSGARNKTLFQATKRIKAKCTCLVAYFHFFIYSGVFEFESHH